MKMTIRNRTESNSAAYPRYQHVDALRAIAVAIVVVAHAGLGNIVPGGSGVTIFFSVSGFIITYLILRERRQSNSFAIGRFYVRRSLKIVPPLVVCVLVPTVAYAIWRPVDTSAVLAQTFFGYNWIVIGGGGSILPGSGVVWSLSIEEQFYVIFALIWLGLVRFRNALRVLAVLAAIIALGSFVIRIIFAVGYQDLSSRIYYGSDTRVEGIALGVLVGIIVYYWRYTERLVGLKGLFCRDSILFGAICLYATSLLIRDEIFRDTVRYTFQSTATCLVILYGFCSGGSRIRAVFERMTNLRAVQLVGMSSYSIYLSHLILIKLLAIRLEDMPTWATIPIYVFLSAFVGIGIYSVIEVPFARLRGRMRSRREVPQGINLHDVNTVQRKYDR